METTQIPGTSRPFGLIDWLLLLGTGAMWGSSFLFVQASLVDIDPMLLSTMTGNVSVAGVLLMLAVTASYGTAFNLSGALQLRNGALAVIWRALVIAAMMTTPTGLIGLGNTTFSPVSSGAVSVLGVVCTGFAFICFTILIGRVGPARASIATYLIPIVAMLLGTLVAGEVLHPASLGGIVLVLLGAYLASKGRKPAPSA